MKRHTMIAAFASILLAAPASAQTIKVGVILTYSGSDATLGEAIDRGLSLYAKAHESDLPPGVKLEIIRRDDTGAKPDVAKRLAQELVTRDHVNFLAGIIWSPNALVIGPLATEAKVPVVVMNAAGAANTRSSPYMVRFSWTVWQNSYPLGKWAAAQGLKKAYTIVSDYVSGIDGENGFTKAFTDAGGQVISSVRVPLVNPDFAPFLQRIMDTKPDVVFNFNPGGKQATAFVKAWSDLGFKESGIKIVATPDLTTDEELPNMGETPLGMVTAGPYSIAATRPQNKAFLELWHKTYGEEAIPTNGSIGGWDGMAAIFDVIKKTKGKFDGDQAIEILKHFKNPDSPRGPIEIDPETRDIVQNIYIRRVERVDGHLANVEFDTIPQVKDPWKELNPVK
jgi:branched-chain amino acid transport system substrate-binding protein